MRRTSCRALCTVLASSAEVKNGLSVVKRAAGAAKEAMGMVSDKLGFSRMAGEFSSALAMGRTNVALKFKGAQQALVDAKAGALAAGALAGNLVADAGLFALQQTMFGIAEASVAVWQGVKAAGGAALAVGGAALRYLGADFAATVADVEAGVALAGRGYQGFRKSVGSFVEGAETFGNAVREGASAQIASARSSLSARMGRALASFDKTAEQIAENERILADIEQNFGRSKMGTTSKQVAAESAPVTGQLDNSGGSGGSGGGGGGGSGGGGSPIKPKLAGGELEKYTKGVRNNNIEQDTGFIYLEGQSKPLTFNAGEIQQYQAKLAEIQAANGGPKIQASKVHYSKGKGFKATNEFKEVPYGDAAALARAQQEILAEGGTFPPRGRSGPLTRHSSKRDRARPVAHRDRQRRLPGLCPRRHQADRHGFLRHQ